MERIYEYKDEEFYLHHTISENPDPENSSFSMQLHDKYELYYFVSGDGEYIVEGNPYKLEPGMVLVLKSGEAHSLHISPNVPYERMALLFSPKFIDKTDGLQILLEPFRNRKIGHGNCYMPNRTDTSFVYQCILNMIKPVKNAEEKRVAIKSNLLAALSCLRQSYTGGAADAITESDGIVGEIAAYINMHLSDKWTLSDLQSELHRNKDYLNRRFKDAMGMSIWEYTIHKRIISARQDIVEGYPIDNVFEKSGFGDYSSFYRSYKSVTGMSPSDDAQKSR